MSDIAARSQICAFLELQSVNDARAAYDSGRTRDVAWRKKQLRALAEMMDKEAEGFNNCLHKDLGKVCAMIDLSFSLT